MTELSRDIYPVDDGARAFNEEGPSVEIGERRSDQRARLGWVREALNMEAGGGGAGGTEWDHG